MSSIHQADDKVSRTAPSGAQSADARAARPGSPSPVGGTLVNRVLTGSRQEQARVRAASLPAITVDPDQAVTLEMLATGVLSPHEGFCGSRDYDAILTRGRLADGTPWTLPQTLAPSDPVSQQVMERLKPGDEVALVTRDRRPVAILHLTELFSYDKTARAQALFGTTDRVHPGVDAIFRKLGPVCLAGPIDLIERADWGPFEPYRLTPQDTWRVFYEERKWKTVVAFQTANPLHRGHEYLQKCALEVLDGLFINPIVETVRRAYFRNEFRLQAYQAALDTYYPKERVVLGALRVTMSYAGPREAILHALVRRNFGCTHMILGRDHAGFRNFYDPYAAQHIFSTYAPEELGITPIFFRESFYCARCGAVATEKTCPHGREYQVTMSGTAIQDLLRYGYLPPKEVMRPEVAQIALQGIQPKGTDRAGQALKPPGDTIKGLFPFSLTHTGLGGARRPTPLDPSTLSTRELEHALADARAASRIVDEIYADAATFFDIARGLAAGYRELARGHAEPHRTEAWEAAIQRQEALIRALEEKLRIAQETVTDPFMYQDKGEVEREVSVARQILEDLKRPAADGRFPARVWNPMDYQEYGR